MITMKDIIREGHPTLAKVATEVPIPLSKEDVKLMNDMLQFIINSQTPESAEKYQLRESVGLAAPQLNLDKRIIAVHTEDEKGKLYSLALANPKIVSYSEEMTYLPMGEGCLSVEIDHLNGHLFIDRINQDQPLAPIPNAKPLEF